MRTICAAFAATLLLSTAGHAMAAQTGSIPAAAVYALHHYTIAIKRADGHAVVRGDPEAAEMMSMVKACYIDTADHAKPFDAGLEQEVGRRMALHTFTCVEGKVHAAHPNMHVSMDSH